jgi:hypothetical protein
MSPPTEPWDGREPITDALERRGLRDVFQIAVDHGRREEAIEFLCDVGADANTAERMVRILIPEQQSET